MNSIRLEDFAERNFAKIGKFEQGRQRYRAFDKFVRTLAQHFERATSETAIVKLNNSRGPNQRCSGAFADLLEVIYAEAKEIWKVSGLKPRFAAPSNREARLDYARKLLQLMRRDQAMEREK